MKKEKFGFDPDGYMFEDERNINENDKISWWSIIILIVMPFLIPIILIIMVLAGLFSKDLRDPPEYSKREIKKIKRYYDVKED